MLVTVRDVLDTVHCELEHNCAVPFSPLNGSSFVSNLKRCAALHYIKALELFTTKIKQA